VDRHRSSREYIDDMLLLADECKYFNDVKKALMLSKIDGGTCCTPPDTICS
jgi:hypothetical protein